MGKQKVILVETCKARMVDYIGDGEPNRRTAHFLNPIGRFANETRGVASPYLVECGHCTARLKAWHYPPKRWSEWVDRMERNHGRVWDAAGVRGAIKATTYKVTRQPDLIWELVARWWCPETNTFVFPWAEVTLTLEDAAVLGGFSLLGEPAMMTTPLTGDLAAMHERMVQETRRFRGANPLHSHWLRHYMDERRVAGEEELEHVAFLSLWLSRFVFPGPVNNSIGQLVFPLAIRLARGCRVALAPAVLAALYRGLRVLKRQHASVAAWDTDLRTGGAVWAPFQLLQMWVWERFPSLRPEKGPHLLRPQEPWAARWHNLRPALATSPAISISVACPEFQWRPYVGDFGGPLGIYFSRPDAGMWVVCPEEDEGLLSFSRCLSPSELVGLDSIEQYLPHRVSMQLGFDQDIPAVVQRANSSWELAWSTYNKPTKKVVFCVPCRSYEPQVTLQFRRWWKLNMSGGKSFSVEEKDEGVHESVQDAQKPSSKVTTTQMKLQQAQDASENMELDLEAATSMEDREQAPEVSMAGVEVEDMDTMTLSRWLGCCHTKRQRRALAELQHAVNTSSSLQYKQTERSESPPPPKSLSSAADQLERVLTEGPNSPAASTEEVNGSLGPVQHTKDAVEVEEEYVKASNTKPGESSSNPITIDDPEEMRQVKLEGGGQVAAAPMCLDRREISSQIDKLDSELAWLRSMMDLASKHA